MAWLRAGEYMGGGGGGDSTVAAIVVEVEVVAMMRLTINHGNVEDAGGCSDVWYMYFIYEIEEDRLMMVTRE